MLKCNILTCIVLQGFLPVMKQNVYIHVCVRYNLLRLHPNLLLIFTISKESPPRPVSPPFSAPLWGRRSD